MGYIIGEDINQGTWAILRFPVAQAVVFPTTAANNRYYPPITDCWFKSAEGNGFLRGQASVGAFSPPSMIFGDISGTFDHFFAAENFVEPYGAQLEGKDVTMSGSATFTITTDAFVGPAYQFIDSTFTGYNPIVSIGLLDPVT
jgi:hypothetical protein